MGFGGQASEDIAEIMCLRVAAMATNFRAKIAATGFVWTIATLFPIGNWLWRGVWVLGQENADIADTLQLMDVAVATIFVFLWCLH